MNEQKEFAARWRAELAAAMVARHRRDHRWFRRLWRAFTLNRFSWIDIWLVATAVVVVERLT